MHLEDESGRVRLVGEVMKRERDREGGGLVTGEAGSLIVSCEEAELPGVIMAALGMETSNGDFEVVDLCFAGLPDVYQPEAGPSNHVRDGKGKAKAEEGDMEIEGKADLTLL